MVTCSPDNLVISLGIPSQNLSGTLSPSIGNLTNLQTVHLDSTQCIERFRKYDTEYIRRLLAKYFSTESLYGGNIFDEQITIGDETIKSSRLPCLRSYVDPVVGFEDQCSNGSSSPADTQASIPNGKHMVKKN